MNNIFALVTMITLMGLFIGFTYWFFRQIRDGRIDPRNDPEWGPYRAPASPHSLVDPGANFGERREYDDDHTLHLPDE